MSQVMICCSEFFLQSFAAKFRGNSSYDWSCSVGRPDVRHCTTCFYLYLLASVPQPFVSFESQGASEGRGYNNTNKAANGAKSHMSGPVRHHHNPTTSAPHSFPTRQDNVPKFITRAQRMAKHVWWGGDNQHPPMAHACCMKPWIAAYLEGKVR